MKKKNFCLKEISPFAVIKTSTLFLAYLTGFIGVIVIFISIFKGWRTFSDAILGTLFAVFILSPVYGIILGVLALIYNLVAKKTGGYQVTLEIEEKN